MSSFRCHDNSDDIATFIITNFHIFLMQLWWKFFQIFAKGDVVYAQLWELFTLKTRKTLPECGCCHPSLPCLHNLSRDHSRRLLGMVWTYGVAPSAGVDDHVSLLLALQFYFFSSYLMKISRFKPFKSGINLSGLMKWLGWSQDHTSEHPSGSLKIVCFVKARGLLPASAWDYKVQWRNDHLLQREGKIKKVWSRIF